MRGDLKILAAFALATLTASAWAQNAVTSIAGGGSTAVNARAASIGIPSAIARDSSGDLYIADSALNRVYKVTSTGTLTIVAGNGGNGAESPYYPSDGDGGPATAAQLHAPTAIALDSSGNIYIADTGIGTLREIVVKTGIINTVAAFADTASVTSVAIDAENDIFAAEGCSIYKSKGGAATPVLVAGTTECQGNGYSGNGGPAIDAQFGTVTGLFVDAGGNLFLTDTDDSLLLEISGKTGNITCIAGNGTEGYSGDGGTATAAELSEPSGVWEDSAGNVYLADTGNDVVRKIAAGKIATLAGNGTAGYLGDGGLPAKAELNAPQGVLVDPSGNVFIADSSNNLIREISATTKDIASYAGNGLLSFAGDGGPAINAQLNTPSSVFVDALGDIFIADSLNSEVREVVAATGKIKALAGTGKKGYSGDGGPATVAQVNEPRGVFVDALGDVFIADSGNHAIREVIAATGNIVTVAGDETPGYSGDKALATTAQLNLPAAIYVDAAGDLIIADSGNNAIRKVTASTGIITTLAGNGDWGYTGDGGPATSAQLWYPTAITEDSSGNIYIADTENNAVRKITASTGKIATVAGGPSANYAFGDIGIAATEEGLMGPGGLYVDPAGNLYIAGSYDQGIIEVNAKTQLVSAVFGELIAGDIDNASGTLAEFDTPMGLAADHSGNLYVADSANQRIRKIAAALSSDPTPPAPEPTFSPAPGVYPTAQKVTLADAASGAVIYYTYNGATPTTSSTKYASPIAVAATTTLRTIASVSGDSLSPVSTAEYTIAATAPAPTFSPLPGTYQAAQTVALTTNVAGATIHYTTNGATPTSASTAYTKPIAVSANTTIKAIAVASGFAAEAVGSAAYVIQTQVAAPVFTPLPQGYWSAQSVKLTDSTNGATIYYTVNGATPTTASAKYTGTAIPVSATTTIKAIAVAAGDVASPVASGLYTIDNSSLLEQRVLLQQGLGIGLSTQTFLSQLALAENVLDSGSYNNNNCSDVDSTPFTLSSTGHLGGIESISPVTASSPGFGTVYYDNACTQPWVKAELDDWTVFNTPASFSGTTTETADFFGLTGTPLGSMQINEAISLNEAQNTLIASAAGIGVFTPKSGAPTAQLGLECDVDLLGFLFEGTSALCSGGIAQNFPTLDASIGFVVPLSFAPVVTPGIAWAGTQFIGASATGGIFTSPSGSAWTTRTTGSIDSLRAVATNGAQLVAVGAEGTVLTSTNAGATWTAQTSGTKASLASIVWSGTQYVAVGESGITGVILTSPNGVTWTQRYASTSELIFEGVAWSGTEFVAVGWTEGGNGIALSSANGITWTASASGITSAGLEAVTWSGTEFVAVGDASGPNGYAIVLTSKNGSTWTANYINSNQYTLYGIVWSPQKKLYIAVGGSGTIVTSPDLVNWTLRTSNTALDLKAVAWSGTEFAAIGSGNIVVTSPDGVTWTAQKSVPGSGELLQFVSTGSSVSTGPLSSLQLTQPTALSLAVTGGTPYGSTTFTGYSGDLVVFVPTPTGWTGADTPHNQQIQIVENSSRQFTGSITQITPAKTLATFTVDRSGTGSITYSDGSKASITNWLPAD